MLPPPAKAIIDVRYLLHGSHTSLEMATNNLYAAVHSKRLKFTIPDKSANIKVQVKQLAGQSKVLSRFFNSSVSRSWCETSGTLTILKVHPTASVNLILACCVLQQQHHIIIYRGYSGSSMAILALCMLAIGAGIGTLVAYRRWRRNSSQLAYMIQE